MAWQQTKEEEDFAALLMMDDENDNNNPPQIQQQSLHTPTYPTAATSHGSLPNTTLPSDNKQQSSATKSKIAQTVSSTTTLNNTQLSSIEDDYITLYDDTLLFDPFNPHWTYSYALDTEDEQNIIPEMTLNDLLSEDGENHDDPENDRLNQIDLNSNVIAPATSSDNVLYPNNKNTSHHILDNTTSQQNLQVESSDKDANDIISPYKNGSSLTNDPFLEFVPVECYAYLTTLKQNDGTNSQSSTTNCTTTFIPTLLPTTPTYAQFHNILPYASPEIAQLVSKTQQYSHILSQFTFIANNLEHAQCIITNLADLLQQTTNIPHTPHDSNDGQTPTTQFNTSHTITDKSDHQQHSLHNNNNDQHNNMTNSFQLISKLFHQKKKLSRRVDLIHAHISFLTQYNTINQMLKVIPLLPATSFNVPAILLGINNNGNTATTATTSSSASTNNNNGPDALLINLHNIGYMPLLKHISNNNNNNNNTSNNTISSPTTPIQNYLLDQQHSNSNMNFMTFTNWTTELLTIIKLLYICTIYTTQYKNTISKAVIQHSIQEYDIAIKIFSQEILPKLFTSYCDGILYYLSINVLHKHQYTQDVYQKVNGLDNDNEFKALLHGGQTFTTPLSSSSSSSQTQQQINSNYNNSQHPVLLQWDNLTTTQHHLNVIFGSDISNVFLTWSIYFMKVVVYYIEFYAYHTLNLNLIAHRREELEDAMGYTSGNWGTQKQQQQQHQNGYQHNNNNIATNSLHVHNNNNNGNTTDAELTSSTHLDGSQYSHHLAIVQGGGVGGNGNTSDTPSISSSSSILPLQRQGSTTTATPSNSTTTTNITTINNNNNMLNSTGSISFTPSLSRHTPQQQQQQQPSILASRRNNSNNMTTDQEMLLLKKKKMLLNQLLFPEEYQKLYRDLLKDMITQYFDLRMAILTLTPTNVVQNGQVYFDQLATIRRNQNEISNNNNNNNNTNNTMQQTINQISTSTTTLAKAVVKASKDWLFSNATTNNNNNNNNNNSHTNPLQAILSLLSNTTSETYMRLGLEELTKQVDFTKDIHVLKYIQPTSSSSTTTNTNIQQTTSCTGQQQQPQRHYINFQFLDVHHITKIVNKKYKKLNKTNTHSQSNDTNIYTSPTPTPATDIISKYEILDDILNNAYEKTIIESSSNPHQMLHPAVQQLFKTQATQNDISPSPSSSPYPSTPGPSPTTSSLTSYNSRLQKNKISFSQFTHYLLLFLEQQCCYEYMLLTSLFTTDVFQNDNNIIVNELTLSNFMYFKHFKKLQFTTKPLSIVNYEQQQQQKIPHITAADECIDFIGNDDITTEDINKAVMKYNDVMSKSIFTTISPSQQQQLNTKRDISSPIHSTTSRRNSNGNNNNTTTTKLDLFTLYNDLKQSHNNIHVINNELSSYISTLLNDLLLLYVHNVKSIYASLLHQVCGVYTYGVLSPMLSTDGEPYNPVITNNNTSSTNNIKTKNTTPLKKNNNSSSFSSKQTPLYQYKLIHTAQGITILYNLLTVLYSHRYWIRKYKLEVLGNFGFLLDFEDEFMSHSTTTSSSVQHHSSSRPHVAAAQGSSLSNHTIVGSGHHHTTTTTHNNHHLNKPSLDELLQKNVQNVGALPSVICYISILKLTDLTQRVFVPALGQFLWYTTQYNINWYRLMRRFSVVNNSGSNSNITAVVDQQQTSNLNYITHPLSFELYSFYTQFFQFNPNDVQKMLMYTKKLQQQQQQQNQNDNNNISNNNNNNNTSLSSLSVQTTSIPITTTDQRLLQYLVWALDHAKAPEDIDNEDESEVINKIKRGYNNNHLHNLSTDSEEDDDDSDIDPTDIMNNITTQGGDSELIYETPRKNITFEKNNQYNNTSINNLSNHSINSNGSQTSSDLFTPHKLLPLSPNVQNNNNNNQQYNNNLSMSNMNNNNNNSSSINSNTSMTPSARKNKNNNKNICTTTISQQQQQQPQHLTNIESDYMGIVSNYVLQHEVYFPILILSSLSKILGTRKVSILQHQSVELQTQLQQLGGNNHHSGGNNTNNAGNTAGGGSSGVTSGFSFVNSTWGLMSTMGTNMIGVGGVTNTNSNITQNNNINNTGVNQQNTASIVANGGINNNNNNNNNDDNHLTIQLLIFQWLESISYLNPSFYRQQLVHDLRGGNLYNSSTTTTTTTSTSTNNKNKQHSNNNNNNNYSTASNADGNNIDSQLSLLFGECDYLPAPFSTIFEKNKQNNNISTSSNHNNNNNNNNTTKILRYIATHQQNNLHAIMSAPLRPLGQFNNLFVFQHVFGKKNNNNSQIIPTINNNNTNKTQANIHETTPTGKQQQSVLGSSLNGNTTGHNNVNNWFIRNIPSTFGFLQYIRQDKVNTNNKANGTNISHELIEFNKNVNNILLDSLTNTAMIFLSSLLLEISLGTHLYNCNNNDGHSGNTETTTSNSNNTNTKLKLDFSKYDIIFSDHPLLSLIMQYTSYIVRDKDGKYRAKYLDEYKSSGGSSSRGSGDEKNNGISNGVDEATTTTTSTIPTSAPHVDNTQTQSNGWFGYLSSFVTTNNTTNDATTNGNLNNNNSQNKNDNNMSGKSTDAHFDENHLKLYDLSLTNQQQQLENNNTVINNNNNKQPSQASSSSSAAVQQSSFLQQQPHLPILTTNLDYHHQYFTLNAVGSVLISLSLRYILQGLFSLYQECCYYTPTTTNNNTAATSTISNNNDKSNNNITNTNSNNNNTSSTPSLSSAPSTTSLQHSTSQSTSTPSSLIVTPRNVITSTTPTPTNTNQQPINHLQRPSTWLSQYQFVVLHPQDGNPTINNNNTDGDDGEGDSITNDLLEQLDFELTYHLTTFITLPTTMIANYNNNNMFGNHSTTINNVNATNKLQKLTIIQSHFNNIIVLLLCVIQNNMIVEVLLRWIKQYALIILTQIKTNLTTSSLVSQEQQQQQQHNTTSKNGEDGDVTNQNVVAVVGTNNTNNPRTILINNIIDKLTTLMQCVEKQHTVISKR